MRLTFREGNAGSLIYAKKHAYNKTMVRQEAPGRGLKPK